MPVNPPEFDGEQFDHVLAGLMLSELSEDMHQLIKEDEQRIYFENRGNENSFAIPAQRLKMHVMRTDDWARRMYEVYCEVCKRQGKSASAGFVRTVATNGITTLFAARTTAVTGELAMEAARTKAYPPDVLEATIQEFRREMQRRLARWQRRLEIEARTLEQKESMSIARRRAVSKKILASKSEPNHSGATWNTIEICFISDERVQIRTAGEHQTLNYAEFGFVDSRSNKPNLAWELLRELAQHGGVIQRPTAAIQRWANIEKRVQVIRKVLRNHFGIAADPIPFVRRVGYKTSFKIACNPSFHT
jgi:hypothetical protein